MSVDIQMAGTGSAFSKCYYNNNAIVRSGDFRLMIDFGFTAPLALHQMNISLNQINAVLITHIHSDHTGGLEELAFQSMYKYGHKHGKIKMYIADALADPLWENALKAGLVNERDGIVTLGHYFDVQLMKVGVKYAISDGLTIEIVKTEHIPDKDSYSLYINDNIFYSADMTFNRALVEHAVYERKCNVILHDCQFEGVGLVHAALDELLTLPDDIQSLLYLMHYDDEMPQYIGRTGKMKVLEQQRLYRF